MWYKDIEDTFNLSYYLVYKKDGSSRGFTFTRKKNKWFFSSSSLNIPALIRYYDKVDTPEEIEEFSHLFKYALYNIFDRN